MTTRSEVFRPLVAQAPTNEFFRFSLGQELLKEGAAAEAITHLQIAVAAKADWMMPRILLGKAQREVGDLPAARAAFTAALNLAVTQGHEAPEEELRALLAAL